jgi:hypothetical protein
MTRLLAAIWLVLACVASPSHAQDTRPFELGAVARAIADGDASAVLSLAGRRVEIGIFGATRTYSRSQAEFVLERFFSQHPPEAVTIERATGTPDGWFASARYQAARRTEPIRLYVRLRREGGEWRLREFVVGEDT